MSTSVLLLQEAVPLGYALASRLAADLDIRLLAIKGPVLAAQGLRDDQSSVDVDVWVDPARLAAWSGGLERLGWYVDVPSTRAQILPPHSMTYAHSSWPCEIDVHHRFPGFLAGPELVFETLWARRTSVVVAGTEILCCDLLGNALVAGLHALREGQTRRSEIDGLAGVLVERLSDEQLVDLSELAARTGATETAGPLLGAVRAPAGASSQSPPEDALVAWKIRTVSTGAKAVAWAVELRRTRWHSWPRLIAHSLLLTEAEIRAARPGLSPGRWGLFVGRLRRLVGALPHAPRAVRLVLFGSRSMTGSPRRAGRSVVLPSARARRRSR